MSTFFACVAFLACTSFSFRVHAFRAKPSSLIKSAEAHDEVNHSNAQRSSTGGFAKCYCKDKDDKRPLFNGMGIVKYTARGNSCHDLEFDGYPGCWYNYEGGKDFVCKDYNHMHDTDLRLVKQICEDYTDTGVMLYQNVAKEHEFAWLPYRRVGCGCCLKSDPDCNNDSWHWEGKNFKVTEYHAEEGEEGQEKPPKPTDVYLMDMRDPYYFDNGDCGEWKEDLCKHIERSAGRYCRSHDTLLESAHRTCRVDPPLIKADKDPKKWTNLVGKDAGAAFYAIKHARKELKVFRYTPGMEVIGGKHQADRVRIFADESGNVKETPVIG